MKPKKIGPHPKGIDEFHDPDHNLFQVGRRDRGHYERLKVCDNFSLDDEGNMEVRPGLTEILSTSVGLTCFSGAGLLLSQDGGTVSSVDPDTGTPTALIAGMAADATVMFCEQAGKVFCSNGTTHSLITAGGLASNWGMTPPPVPTLGTTPGDLPEGRYRVVCTLLDANGVESGAPKAAAVSVDGTKDITVSFGSAIDANADRVRVYASAANQAEMYFVQELAVGSMPATVTAVDESWTILDKQFLTGPQGVSNIAGIGKWRGYMLIWRDTRVMHSHGNAHHLFDVRTAPWKFPSTVRAVAGAGDTCWIATDRGIFNYIGEPPNGVRSDALDIRAYAAGSAVVSGAMLPYLELPDIPVALFASEDGLAVGLPDGTMRHPHQGQAKWDVEGKTVSITYREANSIAEILVNFVE